MKERLSQLLLLLRAGFSERKARDLYTASLGLLLFLFPFGLIFLTSGTLPARFSWTASVFIILIGIVTFLSELRLETPGRALTVLISLVVSLFLIELVGVATGVPFGRYAYTDVLGLSVAGVPVAISVAWYAAVMNSMRIAEAGGGGSRRGRLLLVAAMAGILTVAQDVALEPAASRVELYWVWGGDGSVPMQNYLSWFFLTFVAVLFLTRGGQPDGEARDGLRVSSLLLFGLQWCLFAVLDLSNGHTLPALVSLGIIGAAGILMRRSGPGIAGRGAEVR
ncbi:MAG: carotenoid biosynthesis protein [Bacteroidota bacterium]